MMNEDIPSTPAPVDTPLQVPDAPKKPKRSKSKKGANATEGIKDQAISDTKRPYIMTDKRKAAFAKCQAARQANLASRRAQSTVAEA